ncbi:MAG: hypothetical protein NXH75_01385 [Halobacteriovoraceae bacterium]|nr:hypothetical protein [Halobacteriovoraceae bacterium]
MPRKGIYSGLLLFVAATTLFTTSTPAKFKSTKQAMNEIFVAFVDLLPYASNEMKFKDPKAESYIKKRLFKLKSAFQSAKHLKQIKAPGFQPSFEVVSDHLEQTYETFSTQNKIFARNRLKATTKLCISCHSQLPNGLSNTFSSLKGITRDRFSNDFEYADFLFLVRDYTAATSYFKAEIRNRIKKNGELRKIHKGSKVTYIDYTIEESLERLLTINTKVFYKPGKAVGTLSQYQNSDDLPSPMKRDIREWIKDLKVWEKKKFNGKLESESALTKFIKENLEELDGPSHVDLLVSAGALSKFINKYPNSSKVPEVLFYLGRIDYFLEHSYFYSLSDIYLKNCVVNYPKSRFARKCFQQYKDNLELGFTGTAGTNIPKEELAKLKELESKLQTKAK